MTYAVKYLGSIFSGLTIKGENNIYETVKSYLNPGILMIINSLADWLWWLILELSWWLYGMIISFVFESLLSPWRSVNKGRSTGIKCSLSTQSQSAKLFIILKLIAKWNAVLNWFSSVISKWLNILTKYCTCTNKYASGNTEFKRDCRSRRIRFLPLSAYKNGLLFFSCYVCGVRRSVKIWILVTFQAENKVCRGGPAQPKWMISFLQQGIQPVI